MVKRDFSAWDFVKQKPKTHNRLVDITAGTLHHNDLFTINDGTWTTTVTGGQNNIVLGNNMTISADINDTVFVQNLSVAGTTDIPPQEGQMRTIMSEDGYWLTQVYVPTRDWVTINSTTSFITADENYPNLRPNRWVRFKNWVGSVLS